ncbi:Tim44 domain-containing protein [Candidatus Magnetaquicoccus inordinatus]|uniref:Tim44 domain-containing protein n=1 Tax=Candidatus Magnetaquicoccus inordinatus TaxID=2496818 RepID=UPI00102D284B|nr:Tim44 domain-containing protein [Candidatus Magnetaquicoccus inordinatus]
MNRMRLLSFSAFLLAATMATVTLWPDSAEAKRVGGGDSVGSRGTRSFSTPHTAPPAPVTSSPMRQSTPQAMPAPGTAGAPKPATSAPSAATAVPGKPATAATPAATAPSAPHAPPAMPPPAMPAPASAGFGSSLMSGIAGFALGGLIGSALFGGHSATPPATGVSEGAVGAAGHAVNSGAMAGSSGGGGIGLLEILLIGGLIWFAVRWYRQKKEQEALATAPYAARQGMNEPMFVGSGGMDSSSNSFPPLYGNDEVAQGLAVIASMDGSFDQNRFLEGAKMAFQHIQSAWSDWSVERLRPLLTDRMWTLIETQAMKRKAEGKRDIIEKIRFQTVEITEAWQEAGDDWITVHFLVDMVDYTTDIQGKILEGDPSVSSQVEEFWTFTRPIGSREPAWYLSAIQQPGEVAKSVI